MQAEQIDGVIELNEAQHRDDAPFEGVGVGNAGLPVIDPIGGDVELAVAGQPGLFDGPGAFGVARLGVRRIRAKPQA